MLNKKLLLRIYPYWLLLLVLCPQTNTAQSCVYFAYEPFDYSNGSSLNDYNGGAGWGTAWQVQNSSTNLPGYQINSNNPLAYENLPTIGNYMTGGEAYLTSGRRLNATTSGSFSALVADDQTGIGTQIGSELWVSFLLQKTQNNDNEVYIDLHNDGNISWCNLCASQNIAFGYLGIDHSDVNGEQRWTLKLNDDYYPSDLAVNLESAIFVVLHLTFDSAGTQVAVYIDPNNLGGNLPNNPNLTAVSSTTNTIQSLAAYMGSSPNNGAIDEIRFADSYACVAPDNNTSINLPPQAEISSSISFGQLPLSITFDGSSSTDPEGSSLSYLWDFGDGSPQQTGSNVSHTYTTYTGIISASLTVTDEVGLQNTSYHAITLLDENNTFSCLSSITCLNMASCGQNDGRIRINDIEGNSFSLIDAVSNLMPISNDNEYHNLAPGNYTLTVNGNNGCSDSKTLQISIDSTSCAGWQPPMCSMQIGTNLSSPIDWSPERPFKNLMKHSRPDPIVYTNDCF